MKSGPGCLDVLGSSTVGPPPRLPTVSLQGQVPLLPQAEAVLGDQSHCGENEAIAAYLVLWRMDRFVVYFSGGDG